MMISGFEAGELNHFGKIQRITPFAARKICPLADPGIAQSNAAMKPRRRVKETPGSQSPFVLMEVFIRKNVLRTKIFLCFVVSLSFYEIWRSEFSKIFKSFAGLGPHRIRPAGRLRWEFSGAVSNAGHISE
jgi:hypothetical protein